MTYQNATVSLHGYIGKDPQEKTSKANPQSKFVVFDVGITNRDNKNKEDKPDPTWYSVICWGTLAKFASQYCKKGSHVHIQGKLVAEKYSYTNKDKKEENGMKLIVTCSVIGMLDKKAGEDDGSKLTGEVMGYEIEPHVVDEELLKYKEDLAELKNKLKHELTPANKKDDGE